MHDVQLQEDECVWQWRWLEATGCPVSRLATAISPLTCRLSVILSSLLHPVHRSTVLMFAVQCLPLVSVECLLSSRRCSAFPPVLLHSLAVNSDAAPPKQPYLPCTYRVPLDLVTVYMFTCLFSSLSDRAVKLGCLLLAECVLSWAVIFLNWES